MASMRIMSPQLLEQLDGWGKLRAEADAVFARLRQDQAKVKAKVERVRPRSAVPMGHGITQLQAGLQPPKQLAMGRGSGYVSERHEASPASSPDHAAKPGIRRNRNTRYTGTLLG